MLEIYPCGSCPSPLASHESSNFLREEGEGIENWRIPVLEQWHLTICSNLHSLLAHLCPSKKRDKRDKLLNTGPCQCHRTYSTILLYLLTLWCQSRLPATCVPSLAKPRNILYNFFCRPMPLCFIRNPLSIWMECMHALLSFIDHSYIQGIPNDEQTDSEGTQGAGW